MPLESALRLTEILLALTFVQQGLEHMRRPAAERLLLGLRLVLALLLLGGFYTQWICLALVVLALCILHRFQGPYNGGSDRIGLLTLCCLTLAHFLPDQELKEYAFGYLALQLVLSYFVSGWVKIVNREWRQGTALRDVFLFSTYPVSERTRGWVNHPQLLWVMSWAVMLFEIFFPLCLVSHVSLYIGLAIAALFHLANALLFGLNRFFWAWLAAYPSIIWFQARFFDGVLG